jgi:dihydrofolate synthase/folylpolyglutamate synthase
MMPQRSLAEWLDWQQTAHPASIDLGLDRLQRVLDRLGWRGLNCPVLTVGGTNGKGSCVAFLEAMLDAAGYRVGAFTSPHLIRYNERIRIGRREASDAAIVARFERIEAARGPLSLTFFEYNTLAALLLFEEQDVNAVVLEVGLGGRLDAVNVVPPDVAVVTSIGLDHCEWLGDDLESIGREKAGIFRPGRPAVFGAREMPRSIEAQADAIGAPLWRLGRDYDFRVEPDGWSWRSADRCYDGLPVPALAGATQYANAAAAVAALERIRDRLPVPDSVVAAGSVEWILDVAHNPDGAATLARHLGARPCQGRTIAVCGVLGDKDIDGVVTALGATVDVFIAAGLAGPRALPAAQMGQRLRAAGASVTAAADSVAQACAQAREIAAPGDRIVVFGSFHTVGPALEWLAARPPGGEAAVASTRDPTVTASR